MSRTCAPTSAELGQAVEGGARVLFGRPVRAAASGGKAVLNLAAAARGDADPWIVTLRSRELTIIESASERSVHVGELQVSARDASYVDHALAAAPTDTSRHAAESNQARVRAGQAAMAIENNMVRARTLDHVDGWAGIAAASEVIDQTEEGTLYAPHRAMGLTCRLLIVRCPSTARVYALRVPSEKKTVAEARSWVMRGATPEVET